MRALLLTAVLGVAGLVAPARAPDAPVDLDAVRGWNELALTAVRTTDAIAFDHATDSAPGGVARHYPGFAAAAAEAGRSRVYGGRHLEFSNQAGLALGRSVAREVSAHR
ncbi:hypothetical protein [Symbioplanes lichenis]|uniref:hypothetical protein n=1 Tax=Symbioplanes lichenis TaxID=1629072 RepID=UPI002739ECF9|nr:hypothetical protein [Actinoplanes lichenis]